MKSLLMGIDVGTTHIKAAVFDVGGRQEALAVKENNAHYEDNGFSYYDPVDIKSRVFEAIADTIRKIEGPFEILGVSVASMSEAGLPLDRHGEPLYPIITWFDTRTEPQVDWWKSIIDPYEIYEETGLILQTKYSLNKILWLKENCRDIFDRMAHWLCVEDYILYCLSGAMSTDYSVAYRTMAMNIKTGQWSEKLLDISGVRKEVFPSIYKSGTVVGKVTEEASKVCLLKEGTPVVTGGHDHPCAALALGVTEEGDILDSMGTAELLMAVKDELVINKENYTHGFGVGRYVVGDKFYTAGGIHSSGGSIEWFMDKFMEGKGSYDSINKLSEVMNCKPSGIFYVPHLIGSGAPHKDGMARGAFLGLRFEHSVQDMLKSIYEGTSYEFRMMYEALIRLSSINVKKFMVGGGSTRNARWMEVKANILGMELTIPEVMEPSAMGAALLAGIGVGVYKDAKDAVSRLNMKERVVRYDKDLNLKYDYLYRNGYVDTYNILKPINDILGRF